MNSSRQLNFKITKTTSIIWYVIFTSPLLLAMDRPIVLEKTTLESQLFSLLRQENITREQVLKCINNGVDIHAKDKKGNTPLIIAAQNGHAEACTILIAKGANVNTRSYRDLKPRLAIGDYATPLHRAAENGHTEVCTILIDNGANVNATKSNDYSPLHMAALKGYAGICAILINNGAKLNTRSFKGLTPLHVIAYNGHAGICAILINNGANVNAKNKKGNSPLHMAAYNGHVDICAILINNGANINAKNNDRNSPFLIAAYSGYADICSILINKGADPDIRNDDPIRHNVLQSSAKHGRSEMCILLICSVNQDPTSYYKESRSGFMHKLPFVSYLFGYEHLSTRIKTILLCLKKRYPQLPRDMKFMILRVLFLEDTKLQEQLVSMLIKRMNKGKECPQEFVSVLTEALLLVRLTQLRAFMKHALGYAKTDQMQKILSPEALEQVYKPCIRANIQAKLQENQHKIYHNLQ